MNVIDLHCDVLLKMSENTYSFADDPHLDINYERLVAGKVKVQAMALFIHPEISSDKQFIEALRQVEIYKQYICTPQYPRIQALQGNQHAPRR